MRLSKRSEVDPFIVMDVMEAARKAEQAGRRIVHMEVGQPGTPAPKLARDAIIDPLQHDALGYTVALGIPALKERIARLYDERHGIKLNPERVIVTSGSSGAFVLAFAALFDAGDRVAVGIPGYPSYRQILRALSLTPVGMQTDVANKYHPRISEIPEGIAGMIVASPNNPTGTMLDKPAMSELISACQARGAAFVSDEIYHGIEYDHLAVSALEISDDVVVINSFSKYYSMTGWRLGWIVVPEALIRPIEILAQHMFICASHISQVTALAAMDCHEELQANVAVYARNRLLMTDGLHQAGFTDFAPPDGAFYIYADISSLNVDSREFAAQVLEKAGVALTPGVDFDPKRGGHTLRFSYAGSTEDIELGLERINQFMRAGG